MTARDALRDRVEHAVGALFEVEDEIGRGGMAVVYRARDVRLRRHVALKVLPPDLAFREDVKARFLREAQMAAQLSHPNIVPIYAVDELDGIVFFAMGLVEGDPLARLLSQEPRPPVDVVRRLLREVAEALAYAHARHVVHRDVKPDNILVERATGHALVSDFGIARAAEGDARLTVTGIAVGTPAYMSPEQAMGERDVDGRADIYSLGIVGWQMLAGQLPFQASNTPAMLMKHISERPPALHEVRADLPANLVYAIERAMAKGRDERWPDAGAFWRALADDAPAGTMPSPDQRGSDLVIGAKAGRLNDPAEFGAALGLHITGRVLGKLGLMPPESAPAGSSASTRRDALSADGRNIALPPAWSFDPNTPEYGRDALREWREQRRLWKARYRANRREALVLGGHEIREAIGGLVGTITPEDRIRGVQRRAVRYAMTVAFLAMINLMTSPHFPWFLFAAIGMGIALVSRISGLWVDGIPLRRLFQRQPRKEAVGAVALADAAAPAPPRLATADLSGVSRDVLDGPHGATVREAAEAKVVIVDVLARLSDADRKMLPEIQPTVDSLVERVRTLAQALHQLDQDASPTAIGRLEERIAAARVSDDAAPERDRRLELLERQLATLKDLAGRRATVAQQLESASLVLQTMKLDLLKLRSSGIETKLDATTGATQEARALSTDIGRVLEAANEVRKL